MAVTLVCLVGMLTGQGQFDLPFALGLGLAQGGSLAVAFSMILADRSDAPIASLSAMTQGAGYLIAGFGPVLIGLLRAAGSELMAIVVVIELFAALSIVASTMARMVLAVRLGRRSANASLQ